MRCQETRFRRNAMQLRLNFRLQYPGSNKRVIPNITSSKRTGGVAGQAGRAAFLGGVQGLYPKRRLAGKTISRWTKRVAIFVGHQVLATEGVIWLTILGSFLLRGSLAAVSQTWVQSAFMRAAHLILSNTPFPPVQISLGGFLGWKAFTRWRHRSMLWVWILPTTFLIAAIAVTVASIPWSLSAVPAILSHFFGWGCQADKGCYDELTFTQPFYTSVAYTCGALGAARKAKADRGFDEGTRGG